MIKIGIEKNWGAEWISDAAMLAQAPPDDRVCFQIGYTPECDYLIVLNRPRHRLTVRLPSDRIWGFVQEPPNEVYRSLHRGQSGMGRVYNQRFGTAHSTRHRLAPPFIPWFVPGSWSEQAAAAPPTKTRELSCISSRTYFFRGHEQRLRFLDALQTSDVPIDLFGKGIKGVADKSEALRPYRYSIIIENGQFDHYWTEKLADCFLSHTYPIYCGCPNIAAYFPAAAMAVLDIRADDAVDRLRSILAQDPASKQPAALTQAREQVLQRHNFFSFVAGEAIDHHAAHLPRNPAAQTVLHAVTPSVLIAWLRSYRRVLHLRVSGR